MTETTPEQELLPCPFCGPGNSLCDPWFDDVSKRWRVGCGRCGASTGTHPRDTGKEVAIAAWNSRHNAQAEQIEQAIIDRLNGVPPKVWVLTISHKHGENVYVNRSEAGALAQLADYCREWWSDAINRCYEDGEAQPPADNELVERYFDKMGYSESYSIETVNVED